MLAFGIRPEGFLEEGIWGLFTVFYIAALVVPFLMSVYVLIKSRKMSDYERQFAKTKITLSWAGVIIYLVIVPAGFFLEAHSEQNKLDTFCQKKPTTQMCIMRSQEK